MKIKTAELTGAALDWAVAECEGYDCLFDDEVSGAWLVPQQGYLHDEKPLSKFNPTANWAQGGPIIERERIELRFDRSGRMTNPWNASTLERMTGGPTPLMAAMRCYVASKLGDEIKVPEELLK